MSATKWNLLMLYIKSKCCIDLFSTVAVVLSFLNHFLRILEFTKKSKDCRRCFVVLVKFIFYTIVRLFGVSRMKWKRFVFQDHYKKTPLFCGFSCTYIVFVFQDHYKRHPYFCDFNCTYIVISIPQLLFDVR